MSTGVGSGDGLPGGSHGLFLEEARSAAVQLQSTLGSAGDLSPGNWRTVASLAHQLRGAASFVGLTQVARVAGELEDAVNGATHDRLVSCSPLSLVPVVDRLLDILLTEPLSAQAFSDAELGELSRSVQAPFGSPEALAEHVEPSGPLSGRHASGESNLPADASKASETSNSDTRETTGKLEVGLGQGSDGATTDRDELTLWLVAYGRSNEDFAEYFAPETEDQLEALRGLSTEITSMAPERRAAAFEEARRVVHTLKGAAFMVECEPVGRLAHLFEDYLETRNASVAGADDQLFDETVRLFFLLLETMRGIERPTARIYDELARQLDAAVDRGEGAAAAEEQAPAAGVESPDLLNELRPVASADEGDQTLAGPVSQEAQRVEVAGDDVIRVPMTRIDNLLNLVNEAFGAGGRLDGLSDRLQDLERELRESRDRARRLGEEVHRAVPTLLAGDSSAAAQDEEADEQPENPGSELGDLDLDRYDELDVLRLQIEELAFDLQETLGGVAGLRRRLNQELEDTSQGVNDLRRGLTAIRMVPLQRLFDRLERQTHQTARELGLPVDLEVEGAEVELDAAIVQRLYEPLMHLTTNALVHGLEDGARRGRLNKAPSGQLLLRASAEGAVVQIEVEDDGRGLDIGALLSRARSAAQVTDAEISAVRSLGDENLVFLEGVSTAERVGQRAGRGVGLAAVRAAVRSLKGTVTVESMSGVGTRFTIRVPATLVVTRALRARVGRQIVCVSSLEIERLRQATAQQLRTHDGHLWLEDAGEEIRVVPVAQLFDGQVPPPDATSDGPLQLVVVASPFQRLALLVDEFLGLEDVVVRGFGSVLGQVPGFDGVTVRPDGGLELLLASFDLGTLPPEVARRTRTNIDQEDAEGPDRGRLLLVDDSVSVRRVLGRRLRAFGYQVVEASDGQEALEAVNEGSAFAAVLTDIEMPKMNGLELLQILRRREPSKNLPVIVVTTRGAARHREAAMDLGASAFYGKPVDFDQLLDTIDQLTVGIPTS